MILKELPRFVLHSPPFPFFFLIFLKSLPQTSFIIVLGKKVSPSNPLVPALNSFSGVPLLIFMGIQQCFIIA